MEKIFIAYSASATDHNYCMGLLTVDENADLLDPNSWVKSDAQSSRHVKSTHNMDQATIVSLNQKMIQKI